MTTVFADTCSFEVRDCAPFSSLFVTLIIFATLFSEQAFRYSMDGIFTGG